MTHNRSVHSTRFTYQGTYWNTASIW